jgi:hypothetical protein
MQTLAFDELTDRGVAGTIRQLGPKPGWLALDLHSAPKERQVSEFGE